MANRNTTQGMTAVEVLAATLLSAILMVAVIGVMQGLTTQGQALKRRDPTASWQRSLASIVQRDFSNASRLQVTPQSILLSGFSSDGWLPQTVRYEVESRGETSWLLRTEMSSGTTVRRELVCREVVSISVTANGDHEGRQHSTEAREQPMVPRLVIQFYSTNETPVFKHLFRQT